jgi:radical SAM/Cys-rich protein
MTGSTAIVKETDFAEVGGELTRKALDTVQVNLGNLCNMSCTHCHVGAGPKRTEVMELSTIERVIQLVEATPSVGTVDLTGGAPELNPGFRELVRSVRRLGRAVIDRCNLTILTEPRMEWLPQFLAAEQVRVVASMPCYLPENVDRQRGAGAYERSVAGLRMLNALGYGRPGSGLELDLVYNPGGAFLPPPQAKLEAAYRKELGRRHGVVFNSLLTITNMPIDRFEAALQREGKAEEYMGLLVESFNPATVPAVMCRTLVSVGWDGRLYDCDFNQVLGIPLGAGVTTIWDVENLDGLAGQGVATARHCFGCTAGSGSSCGGALD